MPKKTPLTKKDYERKLLVLENKFEALESLVLKHLIDHKEHTK